MASDVETPAAAKHHRRSAISRLLLSFVVPVIRKSGRPGGLQVSDAASLPSAARARTVREKVLRVWESSGGKIGTNALLWRVFRQDIIAHLLCSVFVGVSSTVARPLLLKFLIEEAADNRGSLESHLWMIGVSTCLLLEGFGMSHAKQILAGDAGVGFRAAIGALLQNKALALASGVGTDADAQTLAGNDLQRMFENLKWLAQLPIALSSIFGGAAVVIYTLGMGGVIGLATQVVMLMLTVRIGAMSKVAEGKALRSADSRLAVLRRVIEGAKAIKFSAWEEKYLKAITEARAEESAHIGRFRMLQELGKQIGRGVPVIAPCLSFLFLAGTGRDLKAGDIFAALTVFESMRMAMVMAPLAFTYVGTWQVSTHRIHQYLALPEAEALEPMPDDHKHAAEVIGATLAWPSRQEDPVLRNVDLGIVRGHKVAVVGETGSGKTSLLCGLLGDLNFKEGTARVSGNIGYVPQRAFTVSGTLCHNVLLGRAFNQAAFDKATSAACLTQDIAQFPDGVETEIGERGVTLSGGQQARVAVARALYANPSLVILDDPLAAVDPVVARRMFKAVIKGADPSTTVIMALNQLQYVQDFDYVIYIADGTVAQHGPADQVLAATGPLADFVVKGGGVGQKHHEDHEAPAPAVPVGPSNAAITGGALVAKEVKAKGSLWITLRVYLLSMGWIGPAGLAMSFGCFIFYGIASLYLADWVREAEESDPSRSDTMRRALIYMAICLVHLAGLVGSAILISVGSVRAGRALHNECARRVLSAPVSWFDATPAGRIISRFASDCASVDIQLSIYTEAAYSLICTILALVAVVCIVVPLMVPVMVAALMMYFVVVMLVDRANKDVRRMANIANSPVLGLLGEIGYARGQTVIRSMHFGDFYAKAFDERMDIQNELLFTSTSLVMWGNLSSYMIAVVISTVTVLLMLNTGSYDSAEIGLAVAYSFVLPFFLQLSGVMVSLFVMSLTALERLLECRSDAVPQEPSRQLSTDSSLTVGWPTQGAIEFQDVYMVYREGLPPALKGVSLTIPAQTTAGVVGRTGAGKSSLLVVLFRLADTTSGKVCIDGTPIDSLGLHTLRRALAIIPQDPLLVEGTIRSNVDPFNEMGDSEVIAAVEKVGLTRDSLQRTVGRGAAELSAGERQLVSLARTLLRGVRIVVLDEPTSNIDPATDKQVHGALRSCFRECTMLTIAHRLETVIGCDQVIVMGNGAVLESGNPAKLLADKASAFAAMAQSHGGQLLDESAVAAPPKTTEASQAPGPSSGGADDTITTAANDDKLSL